MLSLPLNVGQRSLKIIQNGTKNFESLGMVSYSPSIVTMAVSLATSDIFSVKEWPDLKRLGLESLRVIENGAVR